MDKLSQVRGVLRGIRNIAVQGIYTDTFRGMEARCVSTYRKCIATLKTVPGFEDIDSLAPDLGDDATMQEIGFAVQVVLSLTSEEADAGRGMHMWMSHGATRVRACNPRPAARPAPPVPPVPPVPPMPGAHADKRTVRDIKRHMRRKIRAFHRIHGEDHSRLLEELQDEMQEKIEAEQERFEENVESIEEQIEELQEKIEELRERLEERLEEIREKYEEKIERIQEAAEEAAELAEEEDEDECDCDDDYHDEDDHEDDDDHDDDDDDDDPESWLEF